MPSAWMASNQIALEIQPGDIVEIYFSDMDFCHFAMYIGNGNCMHVTNDWMRKLVRGRMSFFEQISMFTKFLSSREGSKEVISLEHVCGIRYCRINNLVPQSIVRNLRPRLLEECLEKAKEGTENGAVRVYYNVQRSNCEHYVTRWKYDSNRGFSDLVDNGISAPYPPGRL